MNETEDLFHLVFVQSSCLTLGLNGGNVKYQLLRFVSCNVGGGWTTDAAESLSDCSLMVHNVFLFLNYSVEINETVICTNDHMEVIIPSAFFLSKVPPVYVSNQIIIFIFLKTRLFATKRHQGENYVLN